MVRRRLSRSPLWSASDTFALRGQLPGDRFTLLLEVAAVLCLGILPYLVGALLPHDGPEPQTGTHDDIVLRLVYIVQICVPLLFIMWRSGRSWSFFGIARPRWRVDLPLSVLCVAITIGVYLVYSVVFMLVQVIPGMTEWLQTADDSRAAKQMRDSLARIGTTPAVIVWMLLNGLAEELVTKSYLIPRLRELCGSAAAAVILSAALFAAYHLYQGVPAAIEVFLAECAIGWLFVRTGRLWPIAIAHAAYDLLLMQLY